MTNDNFRVKRDTIQFQVDAALKDLSSGAEKLRFIGTALERCAVELLSDAPPDGLRQVAAIAKTHAIGVLLGAADLAGDAARLEAIADLWDASDLLDDLDC